MFKRFVEKLKNNGIGKIPLFCSESSEFLIPLFGPTTVEEMNITLNGGSVNGFPLCVKGVVDKNIIPDY